MKTTIALLTLGFIILIFAFGLFGGGDSLSAQSPPTPIIGILIATSDCKIVTFTPTPSPTTTLTPTLFYLFTTATVIAKTNEAASPTPEISTTPTLVQMTVNTAVLNVRSCPGTDCPVILQLRKGDIVMATDQRAFQSNIWWRQLQSGYWVAEQFLR